MQGEEWKWLELDRMELLEKTCKTVHAQNTRQWYAANTRCRLHSMSLPRLEAESACSKYVQQPKASPELNSQ